MPSRSSLGHFALVTYDLTRQSADAVDNDLIKPFHFGGKSSRTLFDKAV
jgi:hypothetical protein